MNPWDSYFFGLLPLLILREAEDQPDEAMAGVAWVVKNRAAKPGWWGSDLPSVILKPFQFSGFNLDDPNSKRFLVKGELGNRIILIALGVFQGTIPDPTGGATSYYDMSMDKNPPAWAKSMIHTCDIGHFHFFKGE